jgi:hypothetical protein
VPYPIVSILDIGAEGRCPGRPSIPQRTPTDGWTILPRGHRFERVAENADREGIWECADCHAWQDELYWPGTLLPRPADNGLLTVSGCECCGASAVYTQGLCPWCIEACEGGKPHVEPEGTLHCDHCTVVESADDLTPDWNGETGNHRSCEARIM